MNGQVELERGIVQAQQTGDAQTLARLQAQYRAGGFPVTRASATGIGIVERGGFRSASPPTATRSRGVSVAPPQSAPAAVVLSKGAHYLLAEEIQLDEVRGETGGWLYGTEGVVLTIEALTTAWTESSEQHVRLDWEAALEQRDRYFHLGFELCGDWHTHPRSGPISQQDIRCAMKFADGLKQTWLSLIFRPRSYTIYSDRGGDIEVPVWGGVPQTEAWCALPGHRPATIPLILEASL